MQALGQATPSIAVIDLNICCLAPFSAAASMRVGWRSGRRFLNTATQDNPATARAVLVSKTIELAALRLVPSPTT